MKKINKKAQMFSTTFIWVIGIIMILFFGILFFVFDSQMWEKVNEINDQIVANNNLLNSTQKDEALQMNHNYMIYWKFSPYILIFAIICWMFVSTMRNQKSEFD